MRYWAFKARETGTVVEVREGEERPTLSPAEAMTCELVEVSENVKPGMRIRDHPELSYTQLILDSQTKKGQVK